VVVWEESRNRQATAVGKYDYAHEFIVVSQVYQNQSGNLLLTPLLLDGEGNTAVLVNRGWIPNSARADLSQFQQNPDQPVQVQGYLQLSESLSSGALSTINPETREIFRLDLAAISQTLLYWSQVGQTEKNTEIREKTRRGTERFLFLFFLPYLRAYSVFSVFLIRDQYIIRGKNVKLSH
jgi:cytochrome oxidase assembly protein ShyY1